MNYLPTLDYKAFKAVAILSTVAIFGVSGSSFAQSNDTQTQGNCTAKPGETTNQGHSTKLNDCNGVLKPPKVGDSEIVEPHQPTGTMPVIKPGELPPNKNQ